MQKNITIVGAGLVGSLLSIYLAKKGYKVNVYERRSDMRTTTGYQGRSINLALSDRGWKALNEVGVADEIKKIAIPMHGRMMHGIDGTLTYQAYGKEGQAIYSVSRSAINCTLMDIAEKQDNLHLHFNHKVENIDFAKSIATFTDTESNQKVEIISDIIAGADGAFSASRLSKQLSTDRFEYNQYYINCAYKELYIPPAKDGGFLIEKNALHIWPRGKFMMIALPNADGSFTSTLFFPHVGENSFDSLDTVEKVKIFFEKNFADAVAIMPTYVDDYLKNPVSSLVTVKCSPWTNNKNFFLIGDAAHAIVPFFGQGMNCGFEDCSVLNSLIEKHENKWENILPEYEKLRKADGDAIADLAVNNFYEMSARVAEPQFLLQKKIEAHFSAKYSEKWIPAYSLVTFSPHLRYSYALEQGQKQEKIMQEIMQISDIENLWNSDFVEQQILAKL